MEQDGTWGDHVILYATANCYKMCIRVISSRSNHCELTIKPDGHVMISTNPLVLGHVHEFHYVSLQPKQGEAPAICCFIRQFVVNVYHSTEQGKALEKAVETIACGSCSHS